MAPEHDRLPKRAEGMTFPCDLDIKVFARSEAQLLARIREVLEQDVGPDQVVAITQKQSTKGNYHSLSCKVRFFSKQGGGSGIQDLECAP